MYVDFRSRRADKLDIAIAIAVAAVAILAMLRPATVLDWTPDCLVSKVTHGYCLGCGMTHAAIALMHGDVALAWHSNRLSLLVLPMALVVYLAHLRMIWTSLKKNRCNQPL